MTPEEWQRIRPILESALELDSAHRTAFLDGACADLSLRREVESLIAVHEQAGTGFLNSPVLPGTTAVEEACFRMPPGKRIGSYEILEEIALGGMGAVYRAVRADGQYKQQVALKIVRADLGDKLTATRFRNERQILASLDHPNIAKILDGGTTAEGLPYFVMEFIDGLPVTDYCDNDKLPVDSRLRLFRTVCSAVHYAHQHLVIHRDLKPSNILITAEGIPKLLDFGIAKILDPTLLPENMTMTVAGLWLMTPEYASPEQLRSEAITTATDVYSLGLVLYELLSGHRAHHLTSHLPHEIARAVLETDPEKPSTALRRKDDASEQGMEKTPITPELISSLRADSPEKLRQRISGDLDNIVLKAIRKEPRERYSSADQLSEDIRRDLEHLPILARKSTFAYRCRKYVQRHKVGVGASALVLLSLLTGIVLTGREARIARANQLRAEQRFNDVRKLANSLIFDVHDSIQDLPGSTAARKLIVEKALGYLDSLAQESRDDLSLQRELAAAYERIGNVQGYIYGANLGDSAAALKSYQKALAIRQAFSKSQSATPGDTCALAQSYRTISETLWALGQTDSALENSRWAVQIGEQAVHGNPNDSDALKELFRDYQSEANILGGDMSLSSLGDNAAALVFRRKQLEVAERMAPTHPGDVVWQRGLGISLTQMGDQLLEAGERNSALQYYSRAQGILEGVAAHSQGSRSFVVLDRFYSRLALVQIGNGELDKARITMNRALHISQSLLRRDPRDAQTLDDVAGDDAIIAENLSRQGKKKEALQAASDGISKAKQLLSLNPNDTESISTLVSVYVAAANVSSRFGDDVQALKHYREAASLLSGVFSANPRDADARVRVAATYNNIAAILLRMQDVSGAARFFHKALSLSDPDAAMKRRNEPELYTVADACGGLGRTEAALAERSHVREEQVRRWNQAKSWCERSLKVWNQISEPAALRPDGFASAGPSPVRRELSLIIKALRRLATAN